MTGKIIKIFIAPEGEAPMQSIAEACLVQGLGIVGDRYYHSRGTFSAQLNGTHDHEVTLIESEQIDNFNRETGLALDYGAPRRNIVTTGIDLNALVGLKFKLGEVLLEAIRLCEPCSHLARLVAKETLPTLVHRAGLRAKIISGGTVRQGDHIDVVE